MGYRFIVDKFLLDSSFPQGHSQRMESLGDILKTMPESKRLKATKAPKTPKAITPAQKKLLDVAVEIRAGNPDAIERAYMARQLVQCTLPHRNPGNVEQWTRQSGTAILAITPGRDIEKNCTIGYPYGSLPRLLLFWIVTEAVQTKRRRLQLGASLSEFMRELGLIPSSAGAGKRSDAKRLREQMRRLFAARITFLQTFDEGGKHGEHWRNMDVAPEGEMWWDVKEPGQAALWESWIELGEKFYESIIAAPVPLDMRALRALKQSPLALDLYAWATYRVFSVNRKKAPQFIPWQGLKAQMGSEYGDARNFKKKAQGALRKVRSVYPALKISPARGGFILHPGPTAVPALA
jgi:hypothetical protein